MPLYLIEILAGGVLRLNGKRHVAYRVENVMLLLALVAAGLGIALAPALSTQVVEQIGNLVVEGIEAPAGKWS